MLNLVHKYQVLLYFSTLNIIYYFFLFVIIYQIHLLSIRLAHMVYLNYNLDMLPLQGFLLFLGSQLLRFLHAYNYFLQQLVLNIFLQLIVLLNLLLNINYFHFQAQCILYCYLVLLFDLLKSLLLTCHLFLLIHHHIQALFHLILDYHFHKIQLGLMPSYWMDNIFLCLHQYLFQNRLNYLSSIFAILLLYLFQLFLQLFQYFFRYLVYLVSHCNQA